MKEPSEDKRVTVVLKLQITRLRSFYIMQTAIAEKGKTMAFDRKIFICSPYAPKAGTKEEREKELKRNILIAQAACMYALTEGAIPRAPHLYFPQFLNDEDPMQREFGQDLGLEWLEGCDELWVIGRNISEGMKKEIEKAKAMDIPVRHYVNKRNRDERIMDAIFFPDIDFREMTL